MTRVVDSSPVRLGIERLVPGGAGMARLADGRPIFVEGGLPGDDVEVEITASKKSHALGRALRILAQGPEQRVAPCPVASECGGCSWMRLEPRAQARAKVEMLVEALRRTGRFDDSVLSKVLPLAEGGEEFAYRTRLRLALRDGKIGFFRGRSHEIVEPERCLVATDEVSMLLERLRACVARDASAFSSVEAVELRVLPKEREGESESSITLHQRRGGGRHEGLSILVRRLEVELGVAVAVLGVTERYERFELLGGRYTYVPIGGFSQVNWGVNRAMMERVHEVVRTLGACSLLDLYSGSGNFSLGLAGKTRAIHLVEAAPFAIRAAERAVREQALVGVSFHTGPVEAEAARLRRRGEKYDVVVADPPRAGAQGATKSIAKLGERGLVMVSCDPVTLARDLRDLVDEGLRIESIEPFDMFPNTRHLESLVVLSRG